MDKITIIHLLEQYAAGTITPSGQQQLLAVLSQPGEELKEEIASLIATHSSNPFEITLAELQPAINKIVAVDIPKKEISSVMPVHRVHFLKTAWFRYAAAVILLIGIGVYVWLAQHGEIPIRGENGRGGVERGMVEGSQNSNKAILTLASGKKIELDNKTSGHPIQEEGVEVTTPRGSQYQAVLPDGTKVWLNAASSIKFPTAFTGKERKVEVTGETFFEVSSNKKAPFVVIAKGMEIRVLGTSFNVSAYQEENSLKTSLVEGAIKVNNKLLAPGQAYFNGEVVATKLDQDIAWKNGVFNFEGITLKEAMNQLARWYDIEVSYPRGVPDIELGGELSRNEKLEEVLKGLKGAGLNFSMEDRQLIVLP